MYTANMLRNQFHFAPCRWNSANFYNVAVNNSYTFHGYPSPYPIQQLPVWTPRPVFGEQWPGNFMCTANMLRNQFHFAPCRWNSASFYNVAVNNSYTFHGYPSPYPIQQLPVWTPRPVFGEQRPGNFMCTADMLRNQFHFAPSLWSSASCYIVGVDNSYTFHWYPSPLYKPVNLVPTIFNYKALNLDMSGTVKEILDSVQRQCHRLSDVKLSEQVTHAYNPLIYAFEPHLDFLQKYCNSNDKDVLFLGMNPGPFGMAQNGVPFGDTYTVTNWLGIQGRVYKPLNEHPKRPIWGFACRRAEISGKRLWGLFQKLCGQPENFFRHCFVYNFCPMSFMNASGKNIPLPQLPLETRKMLNEVCDAALKDIISVLNVKIIICLGRYEEKRATNVLLKYKEELGGVRVEYMSHPSPLNIKANSMGWENLALEQLKNFEVLQYLQ